VFEHGGDEIFRIIICVQNDIMNIMPVGPEVIEYLIGQQPESVQRKQIDNGKGNNHIMAEQGEPEYMFIKKHQRKTDETEIHKIKKNGGIGSCPGDLREI